MGKKVTPIFGSPNEEPGGSPKMQAIVTNVQSLLKWARMTEHKMTGIEHAIIAYETALTQINASLEGLSRYLIENDVVDKEVLHKYAEEYMVAIQELREKQAREFAEAIERERSPIWTPNKKKIIPAS